MDFVVGLSMNSKGSDLIWVVVDRLIKLAHFVLIKISYSLQDIAEVYNSDIVKLHGIPSSIISDRYLRFTSRFWEIF